MKKLFFFFLFSAFGWDSNAQEIWLETGLKGGYGLSFLYNKNIADDENFTYKLTSMYGFGGKFAVNFGPFHGIALEGFYNKLGQDYEYSATGDDVLQPVNWNNIDAALLYRYIRNRIYLELGPMYSFVRSVEQEGNLLESQGWETYYEKNYLSGVFGFGGYVGGAETFSVGLGIRLHYGLTDFITPEGQAEGFPVPVNAAPYPAVETTHPAFAEFLVEFNFGIGYFAKTSCSKRMQFFGGGRH
jgi:hypothetical protein